jgi:hypothetical protein
MKLEQSINFTVFHISKLFYNFLISSLVKKQSKRTRAMNVKIYDGLLYSKIVKDGADALKCQNKKCSALAYEENGALVLIKPHNHGQTEQSEKLQRCINEMEHRARFEAVSIKQIFDAAEEG